MTGPGDHGGEHPPPDEPVPTHHDDQPPHVEDGGLGGLGDPGIESPFHLPPGQDEHPVLDETTEPTVEHLAEAPEADPGLSHLLLEPMNGDGPAPPEPDRWDVHIGEGPLESPQPFTYEHLADHFPVVAETTFTTAPDGSPWIDASWLGTESQGTESVGTTGPLDHGERPEITLVVPTDPSADAVRRWLLSN